MLSDSQLVDVRFWEELDDRGDSEAIDQITSQLRERIESGDIPITFLWSLVSSTRRYVRECGMWVASELGTAAAPLIPVCINALSDSAPQMRCFACETILALANTALDTAFQHVVNLLLDDDKAVRRSAMSVLIAADDNVFRKRIREPDDLKRASDPTSVRIWECLGLAIQPDPPADKISTCLSDPEKAIRLAAVVVAIRIGAAAIPVVAASFCHDDEEVRDATARFSPKLGRSVLRYLVKRVKTDQSERVRGSALFSLAGFKELDIEGSRGMILAQTYDTSPWVRLGALQVMERIVPLKRNEIIRVLKVIRDHDEHVRSLAGMVLSKAAEKAPASLDPFIEHLFDLAMDTSLDSDICQVRSEILWVLGESSPYALTTAVLTRQRQILSLLEDMDEHIVFRVLYVLSRCRKIPVEFLPTINEIAATSRSPDIMRMSNKVLEQPKE